MKKVIFLDIDGVLQPLSNEKRFKYDLRQLQKDLSDYYNDEFYLEIDRYDLGAVKYDWEYAAIENLRNLIKNTGAVIVVSSSWRRYSNIKKLKYLFKIHDLDTYIYDITPILDKEREEEINQYLRKNQNVDKYIILDDMKLSVDLVKNFIRTERYFSEKNYQEALEILK